MVKNRDEVNFRIEKWLKTYRRPRQMQVRNRHDYSVISKKYATACGK